MRRSRSKTRAYDVDLMLGVGLIMLAALILVLYLMFAVHHECRRFTYHPDSITATICDLAGYNRVPLALTWVR